MGKLRFAKVGGLIRGKFETRESGPCFQPPHYSKERDRGGTSLSLATSRLYNFSWETVSTIPCRIYWKQTQNTSWVNLVAHTLSPSSPYHAVGPCLSREYKLRLLLAEE